ncbi:hypothetical protein HX867_08015 [Pseudomonas gingeri]|uniref:hypothetical protein n=1 Tax=Pseudomonas gingeri TaxID=117681 RepID=UPI0015A3891E|nr:hypothetical protein [Pseudomonas gingeri]NVZ62024.1 hypothetical protein [Pseudomonas gingeri]
MHTTASLHVHPTVADISRIFEIRRLAREFGCAYIATKPKQQIRQTPAPFDPNDGGRAA